MQLDRLKKDVGDKSEVSESTIYIEYLYDLWKLDKWKRLKGYLIRVSAEQICKLWLCPGRRQARVKSKFLLKVRTMRFGPLDLISRCFIHSYISPYVGNHFLSPTLDGQPPPPLLPVLESKERPVQGEFEGERRREGNHFSSHVPLCEDLYPNATFSPLTSVPETSLGSTVYHLPHLYLYLPILHVCSSSLS